jgi:hypothetical protein
MQLLTVIFLIIGIFMFMLAAVIGISYGLGTYMSSLRPAIPADAADACARFQADRNWYEELPMWQRNLLIAWWLANRYLCNVKGCQ